MNKEVLKQALRSSGYRNLSGLANALGLHRNTLNYLVSGKPVFSQSLEKMMGALALSPAQLLIQSNQVEQHQEPIAPIMDQLHQEFPEVTFILFGSRARGDAKKYSDFDIGVYRAGGIHADLYHQLLNRKDELIENSPYLIDLVNLNRADADFLHKNVADFVFLTGKQTDWLHLIKKAHIDEEKS